MNRKLRTTVIAGTAVAALAAGGVAIAGGTPIGDDGDERPIRGEALDRAKAAALDHVGGGRVTETETGDEESMYEVEVTRANGTEVDVQLDRDFQVVSGADSDDDRDGSEED
jgi:uncharacterized membrane protein YkoI